MSNKSKTDEKLGQLTTLMNYGQHAKVLQELKKVEKLGPFHPLQKAKISVMYGALGLPDRAIKILGKELAPHELDIIGQEEFATQLRLCYMLSFIGAKYVSERMMANMENAAETRNINLYKIEPQYHQYKGYIYFGSHQFQRAIDAFEQDPQSEHYRYRLTLTTLSLCYGLLGNYSKAQEVYQKALSLAHPDEVKLQGIAHRNMAEIKIYQGELEEAQKYLKLAYDVWSKTDRTKNYAYLLEVTATLKIRQEDFKSALSDINQALSIVRIPYNQPKSIQGPLYWREQIPINVPNLMDKLALRSHYSHSYFSLLCGRRYRPHTMPAAPAWTLDLIDQTSGNDCWLVKDGEINAVSYLEHAPGTCPNVATIDLYSGLTFDIKDGWSTLTGNEMRALRAIIGSGSIGVNQWSLCDSVYRQDFFHPSAGRERIKKVLSRLKKKKFPLITKKNHTYFEDPETYQILMPMEDHHPDPIFFMRANKRQFVRKDLEELFGVKKSTANNWIADWLAVGNIIEQGKGKTVCYQIK